MRFNVISNVTNGVGLQRDYEMLRDELVRRGHDVNGIHHKTPCLSQADVNVFLEVAVESLYRYAPVNWVVPNPEWWFPHWSLDPFDRVLTKTHDATRIFRGLVGDRCQYLGWQARDFLAPYPPPPDPAEKPYRSFLHVAGKSQAKNTEAVVDAARRTGANVTIVSASKGYLMPHNVAWYPRVTDHELGILLNTHDFVVLPSAYEGYGHSLHEAYGCGKIVLTTDAAPMNETTPFIPIPPSSKRTQRLGTMHTVKGYHVAKAIKKALELKEYERVAMSVQVRASFEADRATFQTNLDRLLETL